MLVTSSSLPAQASAGIFQRLMQGIGWSVIIALGNQGTTFAANILLAHLLVRRTYGEYAMVQTTVASIVAIAQLATGYAAAKFVAELKRADPNRAGRVIALSTITAVTLGPLAALALIATAPRLSVGLSAPELLTAFQIGGVIVIFGVLSGVLSGVLTGLECYSAIAEGAVVSGVVYVITCGLGAWLGGVSGALAGAAVASIFQASAFVYLVRRSAGAFSIPLSLRGAHAETEIIFRFSIPAALSACVSLPSMWAASALLARQPGGYDELALFGAANSCRTIVLLLPNMVNVVGMSMLNGERGAGRKATFTRLFWTNIGLMGGAAAIGGILMIAFGPWMMSVFGRSFAGGARLLPILMLAAVFEALATATYQIIQTQSRLWLSLIGVYIPSYSALFATALLLVDGLGAMALAWAYAACWAVALVADSVIVSRVGIWSETDSVRRSSAWASGAVEPL